MQKLIVEEVEKIEDPATKASFIAILNEINRIRSVTPATHDPKSMAAAINKVIGAI